MNDDLKKLAGQIHALKEASPWGKAEIAEAAVAQTLKILTDIENRLDAIEKRLEPANEN